MVVVGLAAGFLTTACWIPQLVRSIRLRTADAFSWLYLAAFTTGVALWLAYGIGRRDLAITLWNALTLASVLPLIGLKARARRRHTVVVAVEERTGARRTGSGGREASS